MSFWGLIPTVALGAIAITTSTFAAENPVMKFAGRDKATGKPCELKIWKTYYNNKTDAWADFRAEAETSYSHGEDAPPKITLQPKGDSAMEGKDAASDTTLTVGLAKDSKDLAKALAFHVKWKHGDHYHNDTCQNLAKN